MTMKEFGVITCMVCGGESINTPGVTTNACQRCYRELLAAYPRPEKSDVPLLLPASVKSFHALYEFARWVQAVCESGWHQDHPKQALAEIAKRVTEVIGKTAVPKEDKT